MCRAMRLGSHGKYRGSMQATLQRVVSVAQREAKWLVVANRDVGRIGLLYATERASHDLGRVLVCLDDSKRHRCGRPPVVSA
jgi:hypothetical protein